MALAAVAYYVVLFSGKYFALANNETLLVKEHLLARAARYLIRRTMDRKPGTLFEKTSGEKVGAYTNTATEVIPPTGRTFGVAAERGWRRVFLRLPRRNISVGMTANKK